MTKKKTKLVDFEDLQNELFLDNGFVAANLSTSLREGDVSAFKESVYRLIKIHGGITAFAKKLGITRQALHQKISSSGRPTFASVQSILAVLGYTCVIAKAPEQVLTSKAG